MSRAFNACRSQDAAALPLSYLRRKGNRGIKERVGSLRRPWSRSCPGLPGRPISPGYKRELVIQTEIFIPGSILIGLLSNLFAKFRYSIASGLGGQPGK